MRLLMKESTEGVKDDFVDPALKPGEYRPLTEEEVELLKKR